MSGRTLTFTPNWRKSDEASSAVKLYNQADSGTGYYVARSSERRVARHAILTQSLAVISLAEPRG